MCFGWQVRHTQTTCGYPRQGKELGADAPASRAGDAKVVVVVVVVVVVAVVVAACCLLPVACCLLPVSWCFLLWCAHEMEAKSPYILARARHTQDFDNEKIG